MPKTTRTPCRASHAPRNRTLREVDLRVLEAAKLVRTAYMKQRANDSRGLWTMLRELASAVWAMETANDADAREVRTNASNKAEHDRCDSRGAQKARREVEEGSKATQG